MKNASGLLILKGPVNSDKSKGADVLNTSGSKEGYVTQFEVRGTGATGISPSEASIEPLRGALEAHDPVVMLGGHDLAASNVGFQVKTEVFANGLSEREWNRRAAMTSRELLPTDIPQVAWVAAYASYGLREDGALIRAGQQIEVGWLDGQGGVSWTSGTGDPTNEATNPEHAEALRNFMRLDPDKLGPNEVLETSGLSPIA